MREGQILFTKDGRKIGNAVVTAALLSDVFRIRTDFGNTLVLNRAEIKELFFMEGNDEKGYRVEQVQDPVLRRLDQQALLTKFAREYE